MSVDVSYSKGPRVSKLRTTVLISAMCGVFALYVYHLFTLQIIKGLEYKTKAKQVALRMMSIPAQRGEIFDRNFDTPLVTNIDSFAVDIIPAEVPEGKLENLLGKLAPIISLPQNKLLEKIPSKLRSSYQTIELKSGISFDAISQIAERMEDFPGVTWHNKPIRNYLMSGSIAHVIGYVGDITREELQVLYNKGYDFGTVLGKSGIEKQYDMTLRGKDGVRYRTVDVKGRRVDEGIQDEDPPVLGKDVVLTIDRRIQTIAEQALGQRIGSVVVLKPSTGEVLAMVSYPYFNPNEFYTENSSEKFGKLSLDPNFPFLNRSIQSHYGPASTFKIVMTAAIMEENAFPQDKLINCTGKLVYGGIEFNCHKKTGHGPLDLFGALAESCDVYFWTVGRDYLGIDTIAEYARRFGFGEKTGIDLPGEVTGVVPSPDWKRKNFNAPWVGGDTMNVSIGQGYITSTPIQLANMVAMAVNDGVVYKPHLLKEVRDSVTGEVIDAEEPQILHTSPISKQTLGKLREGMRGVVTSGTANVVITTKAAQVAGKTGTGQVGYTDRWHSWFASYAPYDSQNPDEQIVVVVMVEAENNWEWWAPYASNVIYQAVFAHQTFDEAVDALKLQWLFKPQ